MDARTMLSFDSDDDAVLYLSNKGRVMKFELDKVFPPTATQEEVDHMITEDKKKFNRVDDALL